MMKKTLLLFKNPWQLLSLAPHNPRASQVDPMKFPLKHPTQMQSDDHHLHICWWNNSRLNVISSLAMVLKLYKTPAPEKDGSHD